MLTIELPTKAYLVTSLACLLIALPLAAEDPTAISQFFEGKQVTVKMDMPGTQKGVDVYPQRPQSLDTKSYADRLKKFGVAVRTGDTIMVTKVKVKSDSVEFQLGGGGYGTAADQTDGSVHFTPADKSSYEKQLEDQLNTETDPDRRRSISRELDDLRRERERQNSRNQARAQQDADARREQISANRVQGGSRFNIHFAKGKSPEALTSQVIAEALEPYLSFSAATAASPGLGPAPPATDPVTALRKGLTRTQVEALLGPAAEAHDRTQDGLSITTCSYQTATEKVQADFVNGVLVQYKVASR